MPDFGGLKRCKGVLTTVMMGVPGHMKEDFTWPYIMFTKLLMHGVRFYVYSLNRALDCRPRGVPRTVRGIVLFLLTYFRL